MNPRIYTAIFIILSILTLFVACGQRPADFENSMTVKEFLYETGYILFVDDRKFDKYTPADQNVKCGSQAVLLLVDENRNKISEVMIQKDVWNTFPNTNIQVKLFSSF